MKRKKNRVYRSYYEYLRAMFPKYYQEIINKERELDKKRFKLYTSNYE